MTSAEVVIRSCTKRSPRVRPTEWLREDIVEVVDEPDGARAQVLERGKAGALQQAAREDGEPDLDLVQPRAVARCVDEANPVTRVFEERSARVLRLEDAGLALCAEVALDAAPMRHEFDERCGTVRVELVRDEDPPRIGIGLDRPVDVGDKVSFRACWPDRWADHFSSDDVEVGDQRQGAMSDVLELDALYETGANGLGLMQSLERLHAGLLIRAHHVHTDGGKLRRGRVGVADVLDVSLVLLGSFPLVLRGQPILALVRSQVRLAKK